jgi:hypothetical protein
MLAQLTTIVGNGPVWGECRPNPAPSALSDTRRPPPSIEHVNTSGNLSDTIVTFVSDPTIVPSLWVYAVPAAFQNNQIRHARHALGRARRTVNPAKRRSSGTAEAAPGIAHYVVGTTLFMGVSSLLCADSNSSAIFSATIRVGALVFAPGTTGKIDASTTRNPSTPRTRANSSVTASGS